TVAARSWAKTDHGPTTRVTTTGTGTNHVSRITRRVSTATEACRWSVCGEHRRGSSRSDGAWGSAWVVSLLDEDGTLPTHLSVKAFGEHCETGAEAVLPLDEHWHVARHRPLACRRSHPAAAIQAIPELRRSRRRVPR